MNKEQNIKLIYIKDNYKIKLVSNEIIDKSNYTSYFKLVSKDNKDAKINIENNIVSIDDDNDIYYFSLLNNDVSLIDYPNTKELILKRNTAIRKTLPAYWINYLDSKCDEVNKIKSDLNFIFITDIHMNTNNLYFPSIIDYIKEHTGIKNVIFGGDIISDYSYHADAYEELINFKELTEGLDFITIFGNHDSNANFIDDTSNFISKENFYDIVLFDNKAIYEDNNLYGYYDDEVSKTRFILVDTGIKKSHELNEEQLDYIKNKILELDSKWNVLLVAHQIFTGNEIGDIDPLMELDDNGIILNNLLDDLYDKVDAHIIGIISGHCHMNVTKISNKGYVMLSSSCDSGAYNCLYDNPYPYRNRETIEGQALDVVIYNKEDKTLKTIRIGAGLDKADRIINIK